MKTLFLILILIVFDSCAIHIKQHYEIESVTWHVTKHGAWYEYKLKDSPLILDSKESYSAGDSAEFTVKPKKIKR